MKEVEQNRKIAVVLDGSGEARSIAQTKLYRGGFGLVTLQCYVPVMAGSRVNATCRPKTKPLCTVWRAVTDNFFVRRRYANDTYNLLLVSDNVELDGKAYMLFERPLPKSFTSTSGTLEMVFAYSELEMEGDYNIRETVTGNAVSRLASSVFRTCVLDGEPVVGAQDGETETDLGQLERAQINSNTQRLTELENCILHGEEKVLVDIKADVVFDDLGNIQYYHATKYFSGGETAELDYPAPTKDPTVKTDLLTIFEFTKDCNWRQTGPDTYDLFIPPEKLGTSDNKYVSVLEFADKGQDSKVGYSTSADSHFKGSDGSILITDVITPFDGRLLIFSGAMYTTYKETIDKAIEDSGNADKLSKEADKLAKELQESKLDRYNGSDTFSAYVDDHGKTRMVRLWDDNQPSSIVYRNAQGRAEIDDPVGNTDISNKQYVDLCAENAATESKEYTDDQIQQLKKTVFPSDTTEDNKLTNESIVDDKIAKMTASHVTYNVQGDPFPTVAELRNAETYYHDGKEYTPDEHDYAIVLADEELPPDNRYHGGQTRYDWTGTGWAFSMGINDRPFTADERAALESGVTNELLTKLQESKLDRYNGSDTFSAYVDDHGKTRMVRLWDTAEPSSIMYRNASGRTQTIDPVGAADVANKRYVDSKIRQLEERDKLYLHHITLTYHIFGNVDEYGNQPEEWDTVTCYLYSSNGEPIASGSESVDQVPSEWANVWFPCFGHLYTGDSTQIQFSAYGGVRVKLDNGTIFTGVMGDNLPEHEHVDNFYANDTVYCMYKA